MIFLFLKKLGLGVFLDHPPMASVLLSALVERFLKLTLGCGIRFHRIGPLGRFDLVVAMSVCLFLFVCLSPFNVLDLRPFLPPLPYVGCPKNLTIQNPCGKVLERSGLRIEHFCWEVVWNHRVKTKHGGNHASLWIWVLWSRGTSLILAYL